MVILTKSYGGDKEITDEEDEVSNAETSKEVIKDVMHWPDENDDIKPE